MEDSRDQPAVSWWRYVRELVDAARNSSKGEAYLDTRIPEILASMPEENRYEAQQSFAALYLDFSFLDRYYELVFANDLAASAWTDADLLIYVGTITRQSGFTAHPKYLEVAELTGLVDVWEKRGPPDYCRKLDGRWACE